MTTGCRTREDAAQEEDDVQQEEVVQRSEDGRKRREDVREQEEEVAAVRLSWVSNHRLQSCLDAQASWSLSRMP